VTPAGVDGRNRNDSLDDASLCGWTSGLDRHDTGRRQPIKSARCIASFFLDHEICAFAVLAQSLPTAAETDPAEFIGSLGNQALEVLRRASSLHHKQAYFHQLPSQDFDLLAISRFVRGS
jgi:hypothetical protein